MLRKTILLSTLGASLAILALSSAPQATEDPISCPYCGGGATLETMTLGVAIEGLTMTGRLYSGY